MSVERILLINVDQLLFHPKLGTRDECYFAVSNGYKLSKHFKDKESLPIVEAMRLTEKGYIYTGKNGYIKCNECKLKKHLWFLFENGNNRCLVMSVIENKPTNVITDKINEQIGIISNKQYNTKHIYYYGWSMEKPPNYPHQTRITRLTKHIKTETITLELCEYTRIYEDSDDSWDSRYSDDSWSDY